MLAKRYLFDIKKWEVVRLAERPQDDERIGLYSTVMEANHALKKNLNLLRLANY